MKRVERVRLYPTKSQSGQLHRGVHVLAATSEGSLIPNLAAGERRKAATTRLQRELEAATIRDAGGRVLNPRDPKRLTAVSRLARAKE